MTFTDTPTFICTDRANASFAMKIHVTPDFDVKTLKKGVSVVVRGAERDGVVGGKQGFVGVLGSELTVSYCYLMLYAFYEDEVG